MKNNKIFGRLSALTLIAMFSFTLQAAPVVPVKVEVLQEQKLNSYVDVHGAIHGQKDVTLTSAINGRLAFVAEPGEVVLKGQLIAKMDTAPLALQVAEQKLIIKRTQIIADFQKVELARYQSLAETDATAKYQIDLTTNNLNLALADIELAKIKLQQLQDQMTRATVVAPFDGIVARRYQLAGTEVSRAVKLVDFLDTTVLEARLYLPIKYLNTIQIGQVVTLQGASFGGDKKTQARVHSIIPHTDERSQTFEIRARLVNDNAHIWATGELVDVRVDINNVASVKLVNRDALIIRKSGVHIVKIDEDNKAIQVPVEIGNGQNQLVEIREKGQESNLKPGDRIAIRGAERLQTGQEVDVQS